MRQHNKLAKFVTTWPYVHVQCLTESGNPAVLLVQSLSSNESFTEGVSDCDLSTSQSNVIWDRVAALFGSESWKIISDYTIEKIIRNTDKAFPRGKIPVFCATIEKIDTALPIARAVLQDGTGKIGCSIDKNVVRKYRRFLCAGAILILKQSMYSLTFLNSKNFHVVPSDVDVSLSLTCRPRRVTQNHAIDFSRRGLCSLHVVLQLVEATVEEEIQMGTDAAALSVSGVLQKALVHSPPFEGGPCPDNVLDYETIFYENVIGEISFFSFNQKTFYLNITSSNVLRIFLDAASIDSRLLGSRITEDVSICGPDFPLPSPPLSVNELRTLVVECLTPLSPSLLPTPPPIKPMRSASPPRSTSRCSKESPHRCTPAQPRDRNRLLMGGRPTAITTSPPSASGSKSLAPLQCRRGIRSILRSTPNAANSQPPATDTPKSVSRVQNSAGSSPLAKSVIRLNNKEDKTSDTASPMPLDWMEDVDSVGKIYFPDNYCNSSKLRRMRISNSLTTVIVIAIPEAVARDLGHCISPIGKRILPIGRGVVPIVSH
ncbi:hypothetical protein TSMEX_010702 [Taenia solium]|eukprot:TsM_000954600 transcript=TsM_000954600 gene=TsM_000954600